MTRLRRLQLAAALHGDDLAITVARDAEALRIARDRRAQPLTRVLAAVAGGALAPDHAAAAIAHTPALLAAALGLAAPPAPPATAPLVSLASAQTGDVATGDIVGGNKITVNVYVGHPTSGA